MTRTKQVIHTNDRAADATPGLAARFGAARSVVGVPMLKDDALIGATLSTARSSDHLQTSKLSLCKVLLLKPSSLSRTRGCNELRQRTSDLTERTADLTEALEQQTATSRFFRLSAAPPAILSPCSRPCWRMPPASVTPTSATSSVGMEMPCGSSRPTIHRLPLSNIADECRFAEPRQSYWRNVRTRQFLAHLARDERYIPKRDPEVVAAVELGGIRTL